MTNMFNIGPNVSNNGHFQSNTAISHLIDLIDPNDCFNVKFTCPTCPIAKDGLEQTPEFRLDLVGFLIYTLLGFQNTFSFFI